MTGLAPDDSNSIDFNVPIVNMAILDGKKFELENIKIL